MTFTELLSDELNKQFPNVITTLIMDILEDVKYTDFQELPTHQYWANRFRKDIFNSFHICEFFENSITNNTSYDIRVEAIKKIRKSLDISSISFSESLNELIRYEIGDYLNYDKYLNKEIDITMTYNYFEHFNGIKSYYISHTVHYSTRKQYEFVVNEEEKHSSLIYKIQDILANDSHVWGIICNMDCIEVFVNNLKQVEQTYKDFLLYFSDYKTERGFSSIKTNITKNIKTKLKLIEKFDNMIAKNTCYYQSFYRKYRMYKKFYLEYHS